jgi:hypothetical protein
MHSCLPSPKVIDEYRLFRAVTALLVPRKFRQSVCPVLQVPMLA